MQDLNELAIEIADRLTDHIAELTEAQNLPLTLEQESWLAEEITREVLSIIRELTEEGEDDEPEWV